MIWPVPPHNSASWWLRPGQLTMGSLRSISLAGHGVVLAYQGETAAARAAADAAIEAAAELGGIAAAQGYAALAGAALAAGDAATARDAFEAWPHLSAVPQYAAVQRVLSAWPLWRAGIWSRPAAGPTRRSRGQPAIT